jgi:ABC-type antimicrobial peptide transport system permease subunit
MNILLKHALRSALGGKIQATMIMLTVVVITSMLFIGFSMSDIFYSINIAEYDRASQGADMLLGDNLGNGETFSRARAEALLTDGVVFTEYFLKFQTIMKTETDSKVVLVESTDLSSYLENHKINFVSSLFNATSIADNTVMEYYPAIVGNAFAKKAELVVGDDIELYLPSYDIYAKLTIAFIAQDEGIFSSTVASNILVDFSSVSDITQVNAVYITFSNDSYYKTYETLLKDAFPAINVSEGNQESLVRSIVLNNTMLFAVGLVFIVAMMMLIQLTSYLIISRNRMSEMSVFKSIGASPAQVAIIMLLEVFLYGICGSLIGLVTGRLIMEISVTALLPVARNVINYNFWKYALSSLIAIAISVIACITPIIGASKRSIRDLTSVGYRYVKKPKPLVLIIISVILIVATFVLNYISGIATFIIIAFLAALLAFWIYFAVPYIIKAACFLIGKIFPKTDITLSTKTLVRNRGMHTITVLVAVIIAFSFIVGEVVNLVKTAVTPYNTRYTADYIVVTAQQHDALVYDTMKTRLQNLTGVEKVSYMNTGVLLLPGYTEENLDGYINTYGARDFDVIEMSSSGGLSALSRDKWEDVQHPVIISEELLIMNKWDIGDSIVFSSPSADYASEDFSFLIVGVDYTQTEYDRVMYIKYSDFSMMSTPVTFLVKASSELSSIDRFNLFIFLRDTAESFSMNGRKAGQTYALSFDEWAFAGNTSLYTGISSLLTLLQFAVYIISLLGLLNISIVTVFDRRRELLIYKYSGMSKRGYLLFSLGESIAIALTSGFIGILLTLVINQALPSIASLISKYPSFGNFPVLGFTVGIIISIAFTLIWSLIAVFNNASKKPVINERLF